MAVVLAMRAPQLIRPRTNVHAPTVIIFFWHYEEVLIVAHFPALCPIALQLAYLGVGSLTIVDPDVVDATNLNRQVLYCNEDVGRSKIDTARDPEFLG